ncbi:MAG: hypothetical protein II336_01005 [Loktanella sp.]|nr:hypothetical protein [Loktanella sp.]
MQHTDAPDKLRRDDKALPRQRSGGRDAMQKDRAYRPSVLPFVKINIYKTNFIVITSA